MPLGKFLLLTTAGSLIWNSIFVLAGFYLGESWHLVERYADTFQKIVIIAVIVGVSYFIASRVLKRVRARKVR
jgi:membrane protein DedA with SNARE-associated domain